MPLIWRYLLKSYFQVFFLSLSGFISVLLVTRFQEIAKFAAASGSIISIILFTLYQIPYILPLAVPISCLISAILLLQKLSHTQELTALRASGMGLMPIAFPLMTAGMLLGFLNFVVASELAPYSRGLSKKLVFDLVSTNPLVILQKDTVIKMSGIYADMKNIKEGQQAKDVTIITKNSSNDRLSLMTAKELYVIDNLLFGKDVSFISSFDSKKEDCFDHILIENQNEMNTKSSNVTQHMQTADWIKGTDYLPLKLLLAKQVLEKKSEFTISKKAIIEIAKRVTLGIAAFTFTLIGVAYGLEVGRQKRKKGIIQACLLASFFMICFVATKSLKGSPFIACMAYLLPHPIIFMFCLRNMRQVSRGLE
ncbi:MAG: YjgP/YjgQ family permease [Chlamydiae bacterium]|nr:YjgP/YjgQ family permease [Chlamydiota bacterium]